MNTINFTYDGTDYTLEFDRDSANRTAMAGLDLSKMTGEQVFSAPRMLFEGALYKHHGRLSKRRVDDIYENLTGKAELHNALLEMYAQVIEDVYSDDEGKTQWKKGQ